MNEEIFETVLNEILEELRKSNKSLDCLIKSNESASTRADIENVKKDIGTAREEVAGSRIDIASVQKDVAKLRDDIGKLQENITNICKDTQQLITALDAYHKAIPQPPNLRPFIRQFRITLFGSILLVAIATIIFFATPYKLYREQLPPIQHLDTALPPPPTTNKQESPPHHHLPGHKKNSSDTLHKKSIYEIADSLLKSKP
jgi:hypothetical protein